MKQVLVKQGRNAGIEYPDLLEEAIGNINLDDWYKQTDSHGFGYALGEIPDDVSPVPDDFSIIEEEETYTVTEPSEDGEAEVKKTRIVRTAIFDSDAYEQRIALQEAP